VPGGFASLHNVPAREITLTYDYWIDKTELTSQDFAECATAGPCAREQPFIVDSQTFPGARLYPMAAISWDEAKTLCEWRGGRLPTEVEWEKAARGPDFRYLPWGNADPECDTTNAILPRDCGYDAGERGTTQVDAHPKDVSPYGVLNMAGSVSEWVVDFPDPDYYATMAAVDPRPPDGPTEVPGKSMRGGWTDSGPYIIYRQYLDDAGTGSVGVRCVYDQLPPPG
jgi:iron(II)-dependent oxidoreductase